MSISKNKKVTKAKSSKSRSSNSSDSYSSSSDDNKKSKAKEKSKQKKSSSFVVEQEFKGTPTLAIFDGEEGDDTDGKFPIIAFGLRKAKAILKHLEEIESWVAEQE